MKFFLLDSFSVPNQHLFFGQLHLKTLNERSIESFLSHKEKDQPLHFFLYTFSYKNVVYKNIKLDFWDILRTS